MLPELSILIPTYNESEIIADALRAIEQELGAEYCHKIEVLIVDDGKDDLPERVQAVKPGLSFMRVDVHRSSPPLGKNNALAMGFQKAQGKVVGFLDVDLSTPPSYIKVAVQAIQEGHDVFIGSRYASGAEVTREQPLLKDVLGNMLSVIARSMIFYGMRNYIDTQCGFKFYTNQAAKILYQDLVAPDGLGDIEVLIRANLLNYRVKEQGVKWKDIRESKRPLSRILFGEVKAILKILARYKLQKKFQVRA